MPAACAELTQDSHVFFAEASLLAEATDIAIEVRDTDGIIVLRSEPRGLSIQPDGRVATVVLVPASDEAGRGYQLDALLLAEGQVIARLPLIEENYEDGVTREFEHTFADARCRNCSDVAIGGPHTCVLRNGRVYCFGHNNRMQIGADGGRTSVPNDVGLDGVQAIACASEISCALVGDDILCWGTRGAEEMRQTPATTWSGPFAQIFADSEESCARHRDGAFQCEGTRNPFSRHGHDAGELNVGPYSIVTFSKQHACGVRQTDGHLRCWGTNRTGALGNDDRLPDGAMDWPVRENPGETTLQQEVLHVASSLVHTCAATLTGRVFCAGSNESGQLTDAAPLGENHNRFVEITPPDEGVRFVELAVSDAHTCGVTSSNELYCWGANDNGQLGVGDFDVHVQPVRVEGSWRSVRAGGNHTCAFDMMDTLYCWGEGRFGQLGSAGGTTNTPRAVQGLPPLEAP